MTIYYVTIFLFIIIGCFYSRISKDKDKDKVVLIIIVVFTVIYGFRFEVGVDWFNYIRVYERQTADIYALDTLEIGYKVLNVIAYYVDKGIVTVIFLSTILFISFSLLSAQKLGINPFYFFSIVAPYHFVMSGMNYTRQGVALSIFLYAISCLINREKYYFLFFITIAGTFHVSAFCFAPLFFIESKKRHIIILLGLVIPLISYFMLTKYQQYLNSTMDNAGLYLRALYLIAPITLLLLHYKTINRIPLIEKRLVYLVLLSFFLVVFISALSSTIADRFSYYFILLNTVCWMLVSQRNDRLNFRYLKSYGNFILFTSTLFAFIVWTLYSSYIPMYEFDSYFYYWLS